MQQVQHAKFRHEDWYKIEEKLDPFGMLVLNTLSPLGLPPDATIEAVAATPDHGLTVCGEPVYSTVIRPKLQEQDIVIGDVPVVGDDEKASESKKGKGGKAGGGKKGGGKKAPPLSRADQIRLQNTMTKTKEAVADVLDAITRSKRPNHGFNQPIAELRLATLMWVAAQTLKSKSPDRAALYELAVGLMKAITATEHIKGISEVALKDIERWSEKIKASANFSAKQLFYSYPRLVISTGYDKVFPRMAVRPYKSQEELMQLVHENKIALIFYNAMIGAGKTTSVVPLATYCRNLRRERIHAAKASGKGSKGPKPQRGSVSVKPRVPKASEKDKPRVGEPFPPQIIFCCSVEPVRYQVASLAYNAQIAFGIATVMNESVDIKNSFSCPSDEARELIVADLISTLELLKAAAFKRKNNQNYEEYILFLDEPTVAADTPEHPITQYVVDILSYAPELTILSSATMPDKDDIPELVALYKNRHPDGTVLGLQSREALIGCEIITASGKTLSPHTYCETSEDLEKVISVIEDNAFLGRLYTAPIVYRLRERLEKLKVPGLPDLESVFQDVHNLSQIMIQEVARTLLRKLVETQNDEIIKEACQPISSAVDKDVSKLHREVEDFAFDSKMLFTTMAYRFAGGCLITVDKPVEFAEKNSDDILSHMGAYPKIIKTYETLLEKYRDKVAKINSSVKSEDVKTQRLQEVEESERPRLEFPPICQINTKEHMEKFASRHIKAAEEDRLMRTPLILENLPFSDLGVPDWIIMLLFAGIGIYEPDHLLLNDRYTELVLDLTTRGQLAFLISSSSIAYGANYPFYHVVIEDEMAMKRSMKTLFQLMGRAGRVGKSWTAKVHLMGPKLEERLIGYVRGAELGKQSEEAQNLLKAVEHLWSKP
jgi:hypothetical protein